MSCRYRFIILLFLLLPCFVYTQDLSPVAQVEDNTYKNSSNFTQYTLKNLPQELTLAFSPLLNILKEEPHEDDDTYTVDKILQLYSTFQIKNNFVEKEDDIQITEFFRTMAGKLAGALTYYPSQKDQAILVSIFFAYHQIINDITYRHNTVAFLIYSQWIFYSEGKMLLEQNFGKMQEYRAIFYPYSTQELEKQYQNFPALKDVLRFTRSSDFQLVLLDLPSNAYTKEKLGELRQYIDGKITEYNFLGKKVRSNIIMHRDLERIQSELTTLRRTNKAVDDFLSEIKQISSYVSRTVKNSSNISMHALGLALDIMPNSFEGKEVYWLWTKEKFSESSKWKKVPLKERWLIPTEIVKVFEKHGFIWGGKWPHFDTMHFEYRPELIFYDYIRNMEDLQINWFEKDD